MAILGRAKLLLTSFDARPGENLVAAIDLRGAYQEPYAYWNASTGAPPQRLREDLELLAALAEDGLCAAAKDISMAGALGTALMMLECSGVGAVFDVDPIPRPDGVALERWLASFPSYGFLLSVSDASLAPLLARFAERGIACAASGRIDGSRKLTIARGAQCAVVWNLGSEALIGCAPDERQGMA